MTELDGKQFYDADNVFERYVSHRGRANNPNELIEKPIILELLNGVSGNVLDLGCGYGDLAREIIQKGATQYTGIDSSSKMIAYGKAKLDQAENIHLFQSNLEDWDYGNTAYDWVISRLVFHYVPHLAEIIQQLHKSLRQGGKLLLSVEHPVMTSSMGLPRAKGRKSSWLVDQYFDLGVRKQEWMGSSVVKYHRSLEEYWRILKEVGFKVTEIREGCPKPSNFEEEEEYERRKRIPLFLILKAIKIN